MKIKIIFLPFVWIERGKNLMESCFINSKIITLPLNLKRKTIKYRDIFIFLNIFLLLSSHFEEK